jgi:hypothetical protein
MGLVLEFIEYLLGLLIALEKAARLLKRWVGQFVEPVVARHGDRELNAQHLQQIEYFRGYEAAIQPYANFCFGLNP